MACMLTTKDKVDIKPLDNLHVIAVSESQELASQVVDPTAAARVMV